MPSRVSTAQIFSNAQTHIGQARSKELANAEKAATQKELTRPSQAPAEWAIAANLKDDLSIREAIAKNASLATHFLTATENIIAQTQEAVGRAHELALQASGNPSADKDHFHYVLPEVEGLFGTVITSLNTRFANRALFGGYKSTSAPFDKEGNFSGDNNKIEIEIDRGLKVPVNVVAQDVIFGEGLENGVNLVDAFRNLIKGLRTRDENLVRSTLDAFPKLIDQLSYGRTQLAGSQLEIKRVLETHDIHEEQGKAAIAKIEEADPVKVFSDLVRDQTVLRAAIETNRKVLTDSPTDILFR